VINTVLRVINSIKCANQASRIGKHGKESASLDHLREFLLLPSLVRIDVVNAHCQNFRTQFLECGIFDGNCRQFRRSDRAEVRGIEEKDDPAASILREAHFSHLTVMQSIGREVRSFLANHDAHAESLLSWIILESLLPSIHVSFRRSEATEKSLIWSAKDFSLRSK